MENQKPKTILRKGPRALGAPSVLGAPYTVELDGEVLCSQEEYERVLRSMGIAPEKLRGNKVTSGIALQFEGIDKKFFAISTPEKIIIE